jgi:transitional endoplasmic reticulum ATPase
MRSLKNCLDEIIKKYVSNVSNIFFLVGNHHDYYIDEKHIMVPKNLERVIGLVLEKELNLKNQKVFNFDNTIGGLISSILSEHNHLTIIKNAESILGNGYHTDSEMSSMVGLFNVLASDTFRNKNAIAIFLVDDMSNIHPLFKKTELRAEVIKVPFPGSKERLMFIEYLYETLETEKKKKKLKIDIQVTPHQLTKITNGMSLHNIEDIYLYARYTGVLDKNIIKERKEEIMKKEYDEVLEVIDDCPFRMKDYAGNEALKEYVDEVVIDSFTTGDFEIFPKGLLLLGAPGTGKTFLAKCIAGESGVPYIELKMSKILSKWVGESEGKLSKALSGIASIGNCVVLLDEIDQILKRDNGDANPVRGNFFSAFLSFLNDSPRGILWVGTTNKCEDIDSALKRSGRFDMKIAILPPDKEERKSLFRLNLLKKLGEEEISKINYEKIAENSFGLTHADIVVVCQKAFEFKKRKKLEEINEETILKALEYTKPDLSNGFMNMVKSSIDNSSDRELINRNWIKEYNEWKKTGN